MSRQLREAYGDMLRPHAWDVFLTLTFDPERLVTSFATASEAADKAFRRLVQFANEQLYGRRWLRKTRHKGLIWVRVQESHRSGRLHYHACLHSPTVPFTDGLRRAIRSWWRQRFGQVESERPKSNELVIRYMTKHVNDPEKAELSFSHNYPKHR